MPAHDGIAASAYEEAERGRLFYFPNTGTNYDAGTMAPEEAGHTAETPVDTSVNHGGIDFPGAVEDVIFGKLYILPAEIDFGFILEALEAEILLWNADLKNVKTVSGLDKINETGAALDHETVPFDIMRGDNKINTVTVYKDGPPIQDTTYQYTAGSDVYAVNVTGKRILAWKYEPNWKGGVRVRYGFHTVMARNTQFTEQRRSLVTIPIRRQNAEFLFEGIEQQRFYNELRTLSLYILAIPLYTEPIMPSEDLEGETEINTETRLDTLYNLNNLCDYVLIKRKDNNKYAEIKKISSVASYAITVETPVVEAFLRGETIIYPCIIGVVDTKKPAPQTSRVIAATLDFREIAV